VVGIEKEVPSCGAAGERPRDERDELRIHREEIRMPD